MGGDGIAVHVLVGRGCACRSTIHILMSGSRVPEIIGSGAVCTCRLPVLVAMRGRLIAEVIGRRG